MPTHSIYSVRDKRKVDAEVIDIREVSGAKGVRYQIVGRHPEDGTTVTTFCSAAVAEDYRAQLGDTTQHAAESVDHIPQPEAPVVSTDGTPIDDDLETFVEDPLVGSASQGTLTSAKVLAAEGELSKTSCCCGATEDEPCACMTADEPMQCSSTEPKCACYAALDAKDAETMCPCTNCGCGNGKAAETVAGIDVQTPSQIAIETPDSDELVVPDPDLLVNGDGRVLGQQTGAVNTTPLHAEEKTCDGCGLPDDGSCDCIAHASDRSEMIMQEHIEKGIVKEDEYYTLDSNGNIIETDDDPSGFTERGREVFESFYSALVEGTDESDICYLCGTTDDVNECWTCDTAYCIKCDPDEMRSDEDGHTYCHAHGPDDGKSAESNFSGHTEDQVTYIKRKGYEPDMVCSDCFSCFEDGEHSCESGGLCGCSWEEVDEYDAEPAFARNKRVLIPTAVIGGLALAYLAKPELLSGSFDKISDLLGKLTKKDDKPE